MSCVAERRSSMEVGKGSRAIVRVMAAIPDGTLCCAEIKIPASGAASGIRTASVCWDTILLQNLLKRKSPKKLCRGDSRELTTYLQANQWLPLVLFVTTLGRVLNHSESSTQGNRYFVQRIPNRSVSTHPGSLSCTFPAVGFVGAQRSGPYL
jgi:hypothetical protein